MHHGAELLKIVVFARAGVVAPAAESYEQTWVGALTLDGAGHALTQTARRDAGSA